MADQKSFTLAVEKNPNFSFWGLSISYFNVILYANILKTIYFTGNEISQCF